MAPVRESAIMTFRTISSDDVAELMAWNQIAQLAKNSDLAAG